MDLNYILIWIVCLSCLIFIIRAIRVSFKNNLFWIIISSIILGLTLILGYFLPDYNGFISFIIWVIFLLMPLSMLTEINKLIYQEKYTKAKKLAHYLKYLHPFDGCLELSQLIYALEIASAGDLVRANQILETCQNKFNTVYYSAKIILFWLKGDWENCLNWFNNELSLKQIYQDSNLLIYYLRALGENGKIEELLHQFTIVESILDKTGDQQRINLVRMMIFAFCGKPEIVEKIFIHHLSIYPKNTKIFWLATARFFSEQKNVALENFNNLKQTSNLVLLENINWRLAHPFNLQNLPQLSQKITTRLNDVLEDEITYQKITKVNFKKAYLTHSLIIINCLVFFIEIKAGGSTNLKVLETLGALIPEYIWQGQYWRLIMANFLHYGWLHLIMNMFGLWIVGSFAEKIIGHFFYGLIYSICAIGGMALFSLIAPQIVNPHIPILLVGASGAIMGLVGLILAVFIKLSRDKKSPLFSQRLKFLIIIILVQFIFDFLTPQVSFMIHALGFILGLITGLFIPLKKI
jgi:rhomboid protease GluP